VKALSARPTFQPYWGKPAVRLIGEVVETAASCEARSAPPPYPTAEKRSSFGGIERVRHLSEGFDGREHVLGVAAVIGDSGYFQICTISETAAAAREVGPVLSAVPSNAYALAFFSSK
jgi:hypothetical protein